MNTIRHLSPANRAVVALIAVTAAWGSSFVVLKSALAEIPVADFLALRFVLAAAVTWAIFPSAPGRLSGPQLRRGLVLGVIFGVAQLLQGAGLAHTSVAVSGFLTGTYVVLTPVLGAVVLGLTVGRRVWIATAVAAVGLAVISLHGFALGGGEILTLLAALAFAAHILAMGRWVGGADPIGLAVVQLIAVAAVCTIGAVPGGIAVPSSPGVWIALVYMALVTGALALVVQTWAQARIDATRAAIVMSTEPVWAAVLAVVFMGEHLGPRILFGGGLVLVATYLAESKGAGSRTAERPESVPAAAADESSRPGLSHWPDEQRRTDRAGRARLDRVDRHPGARRGPGRAGAVPDRRPGRRGIGSRRPGRPGPGIPPAHGRGEPAGR
jgi:drug/metabolite transporter (DMT)-like permease